MWSSSQLSPAKQTTLEDIYQKNNTSGFHKTLGKLVVCYHLGCNLNC